METAQLRPCRTAWMTFSLLASRLAISRPSASQEPAAGTHCQGPAQGTGPGERQTRASIPWHNTCNKEVWQKAVHRTTATQHRGGEPPSPAPVTGNREGIEGRSFFGRTWSRNTAGEVPFSGLGSGDTFGSV